MAQRGAPLGNQNGVKNRPWLRALEKAAAQDPNKLARIALKVLDMAEGGDISAIRELADRLDGKPMQQVTLDATVENRNASELSDAALLAIAQGKQGEEHVH